MVSIRHVMRSHAFGGLLLLFAALLALLCSNTPLQTAYVALIHYPLPYGLGSFSHAVNDGLMALFFLHVGLEIKRDLCVGHLRDRRHMVLPLWAALGGMLCPALIYYVINASDPPGLPGWAIPTATDIAFALAILSLLGPRVPRVLTVFLTALAIFDDVGAILIIALFYAKGLSVVFMGVSLALLVGLWALHRQRHVGLAPYLCLGVLLWGAVLCSGLHATLAGVLLAFFIPMTAQNAETPSPLARLEQALHPWVIYGVLPLFAFVNAGIVFSSMGWTHVIDEVPLGIIAGLFVGKQLGVFGFVYGARWARWIELPPGMTAWGVYGVSLLSGIGFTMSLFIGMLAFGAQAPHYLPSVRLGVMVGSLLSGVLGYVVLRWHFSRRR